MFSTLIENLNERIARDEEINKTAVEAANSDGKAQWLV